MKPQSSWRKSKLGYVVFASHRYLELLKTLASMKNALWKRAETTFCIISHHVTSNSVDTRLENLFRTISYCKVTVLRHKVDLGNSSASAAFTAHWLWTLERVFED